MVWFTKLPPEPTGTYRARIYGIAVNGRPGPQAAKASRPAVSKGVLLRGRFALSHPGQAHLLVQALVRADLAEQVGE